MNDTTLLSVENLSVDFRLGEKTVHAVKSASFTLGRERLGIVGESGSGKSTVGRAILRLDAANSSIQAESVTFEGRNLLSLTDREMRNVRGKRISMVMQDARFALNPVLTVGEQIAEAYRAHAKVSRGEARNRAIEMLEAVHIRNPGRVVNAYPHELSGGMGQRVMIAMMIVPEPSLLIADEPTSALDVTVQMQVLDILDEMVERRGMGLIFISHDLNLVSSFCDRVLIMYRGRIVESCRSAELPNAKHPYSQGLLGCIRRIDEHREKLRTLQRDDQW